MKSYSERLLDVREVLDWFDSYHVERLEQLERDLLKRLKEKYETNS